MASQRISMLESDDEEAALLRVYVDYLHRLVEHRELQRKGVDRLLRLLDQLSILHRGSAFADDLQLAINSN